MTTAAAAAGVFPAYAGMSPHTGSWDGTETGFPRLRGDEPD